MLKKFRYGIVLLIGAVAIAGTALAASLIRIEPGTNGESTLPDISDTFDEDSESEWTIEIDTSEEQLVSVDESELPVLDDTDKELVLFGERENPYTGLRGYFFGRLKVNYDKVDTYLNVRQTPSPDGLIETILYPTDVVKYLGRQGDWYYVSANGFKGFVHASFVIKDDTAYRDMKDHIGYAVLAEKKVYLFLDPKDEYSGVMTVDKGESLRVVGVQDNCYKVVGDFVYYEHLYIRQDQCILYYMFLEASDDNGLTNLDETILAAMEVGSNLERVYNIREQIRTEQEALEASIAASKAAYEASSIAAVEASKAAAAQASKDAAAASAAAAAAASKAAEASKAAAQAAAASSAFREEQLAYDAVHYAERTQFLEDQQNKAKQYDLSTLQQVIYKGNENCRVTYYCHCTKCCGVWGRNDINYEPVRNGIQLVENYTVAVDRNIIPLGTKLLGVLYDANGNELSRQLWMAADTGVKDMLALDIYRKTHTYAQTAYTLGGPMPPGMYRAHYYVKLYIIP